MLKITKDFYLNESQLKITFVASPGPGGQNVNKLATAALLRFNIYAATMSDEMRSRFISLAGNRLTASGDFIIKATRHRTQERNKQDAIERLVTLLKRATIVPRKRKKTRPTKASVQKRLDKKKLQSKKKSQRRQAE